MGASPPAHSSRPLGAWMRASRRPRSHERNGRGPSARCCRPHTPAFPGRKRPSRRGHAVQALVVPSGRELRPGGDARIRGKEQPGGSPRLVSVAARIRPTQQRAGAPSGAPGLLLCQGAGVSPCAPGRRPFREQAHAEAERCCSRIARAFSTGCAGVSDCSRPGVDVGRAAASCDREVLDEVVAGLGASIMGVAAADGQRA